MDWIRRNKFMAGFLAFVTLGAGALIYLLVTQMSVSSQVSQDYDTAVAELHRLQGLEPYPEDANLRKLDDLRKNYAASVASLQTRLAAYEPPPENPPPTPIQFQDKLRRVVDEVTRAAQGVNMTLPDGFYLGFEQYRSTPPDTAAAPALSRQLDAVQDLVGILIQKHVEKLNSVKRAPLPQEAGGAGATSTSNAAAAGRPGQPKAASADLVTKFPVEIAFTAQPSNFRETLNAIVTAKRLYIVRALQVKNQMDKGPSRDLAGGPGQSSPPPQGGPGQPPPGASGADPAQADKPPLRYIVGLEKLDVDLRIELARVAPAAAAR